jgi:hypothetical protein
MPSGIPADFPGGGDKGSYSSMDKKNLQFNHLISKINHPPLTIIVEQFFSSELS